MKKNKKEIPIKNYIILITLFVCTILILYFITEKYESYKEYEKKTPVIADTLHEISTDEIFHYVTENPNVVLYMCVASDDVCRDYETSLKKLVKKEGLEDSITYINLTNTNIDEFVSNFNNQYKYKKSLTTSYPAFVIIKDNEIIDILQGTNEKPLTIDKTEDFLGYYEVGKDYE